MFIGKSVCLVGVGAITAICLLVCLDKKVEVEHKIAMAVLTAGVVGIVASL